MPGIIADDLTGAAELGGVAWRYGLTAEVQVLPGEPASAKALVLDTDSRCCAPNQAGLRARQAAQALRGQGWIYKKIDSVLRGPVLAELDGALAALGLHRALVVPANPGLARVIRDGLYFVGGKPLHETDFRNDPRHPRHSSSVLELLARAGSQPVLLGRPSQPLPAHGIVIGEASTREDLLAWARKLDPTILPVGGAEFFSAILEVRGRQARAVVQESSPASSLSLSPGGAPKAGTPSELAAGTAAPLGWGTPGAKALFICGSAAAATMRFLSDCRRRGVPVCSMPHGLRRNPSDSNELRHGWAEAALSRFGSHDQVVIAIDQPLVAEPTASQRFGEHLLAVAQAILQREPARDLYVEGGATAAGLVRAMGWTRFKVVRELAPGVVTMGVGSAETVRMTMKPGSYTWPATLWSAGNAG